MTCIIGAVCSVRALLLVGREKQCPETELQVSLKQASKIDQVSGTKNLSGSADRGSQDHHLSCRHPSFSMCSGDIT